MNQVNIAALIQEMATQEEKRKRVADLLSAQVKPRTISNIVGVSLSAVYAIRQAMVDGKGMQRKPGSCGQTKRTNKFLRDLEAKIAQDPTKSMRRLASELKVAPGTVRRAVKSDLGLKSYARTPRHLLTEAMKTRRLERCRKVRSFLKKSVRTVIIFSDEKIFTVDAVVNRRNDRYLAESLADVKGTYRTKHPAQVMMLGVVASDGKKMPPYFFKPGERVNADAYYKVLRYHVLPWLKANYPEGNYVWTQDGAPCHTARKVQQFCKSNFADFWPSSSPDLNPLDYAIWGVVEQATNKNPHPNVDSLKEAIKREWHKMSANFVIDSCLSFRKRVEAVIANNGGHIE